MVSICFWDTGQNEIVEGKFQTKQKKEKDSKLKRREW
jgi:hypothetical protein